MMIDRILHERYKVISPLGKGAMGDVYRAVDMQTSQDVAVKIIAGDLALDAEALERFKREGEVLRQLNHPNIVKYIDTFPDEGKQAIVIEYVPGGNLHNLIRQGPLPWDRARQIALDLCDALIRTHRLGVVHRDIKPENILIAADGSSKLTDFGVASLLHATRLTGTGTQVGTPYYMSPEAWEGKPLDARADIWSLGIVLYEMLAGEVPFGGDTLVAVMNKVLTASLPNLRARRHDIPDGLSEIMAGMLSRDRELRYQSMREVAADLEQGRANRLPTPLSPVPSGPAHSRGWSSLAAAIVVVGLVVVVGIAGAVRLGLGGSPLAVPTGTARAQGPALVTAGPSETIDIERLVTQLFLATATAQGRINQATRQAYETQSVIDTVQALTPSATPGPTATPKPSDLGLTLALCGGDLCANRGTRTVHILLLVNVVIGLENGGMSFSPDGKQIVFAGCPFNTIGLDSCARLYIEPASGGDRVILPPRLAGRVVQPAWSPDGQWIAYTNDVEGSGLHVIHPDGTGKRQIFPLGRAGNCIMAIAWSPDSRRLAVLGSDCNQSPVTMQGVWVAGVDGSGFRQVIKLDNLVGDTQPLAWSPDRNTLALGITHTLTRLIPVNCNADDPNCTIGQQETLDEFPITWSGRFSPQWMGQAAFDPNSPSTATPVATPSVAPQPPQNVSVAYDSAAGEVIVSWQDSSSTETGFAGRIMLADGNIDLWTFTADANYNQTRIFVGQLNCANTYRIEMWALNAVGKSSLATNTFGPGLC